MNKSKICIIGLLIVFFLPQASRAGLSNPGLKGKILLQVEKNGEAWYVDPVTEERVYLGRPADAFRVMRERGLGISEQNFNAFLVKVPEKFAGRILLRVEAKGEAYYVNPKNLKMHFLGRPADAFRVMREQGLGITDNDLKLIPINEESFSVEQVTAKVLNYAKSLVQDEDKITVAFVSEEDCLYKFAVNTYGTKITSYSDKSGTKFFPEAMDIPSEGLSLNSTNQYNQTLEQVKAKIQNFIDRNLVASNGPRSIIREIVLEDCLYKFTVDVGGTKVTSYVNRAVTKFFPEQWI